MTRSLLSGQNTTRLPVDEIIDQIDKIRGKTSYLEFMGLLIRNSLEKYQDCIEEEEGYRFIKEVIDMLALYAESSRKARFADKPSLLRDRYVGNTKAFYF